MDLESSVYSSTSTNKSLSPGRIRTMKEYEEQMAELKKENFNLKLRIYFTEERQEQMKGIKDTEELFNKNLELKYELDSLRKDLSEKEELLIQSARAVEIIQQENQDKVEEMKSEMEKEKTYLEDHIENLQKALKEKEKKLSQKDSTSSLYRMPFGYNREKVEQRDQAALKAKMNNVTNRVVSLEEELEAEKENRLTLQRKLECATEENIILTARVRSLETELEKREAHLQQAYVDLERKSNSSQSSKIPIEKKDEKLIQKEKEMEELLHMINEIEKKFETSVNCKDSGHSLSRSSSSNNSLSSCKDRPTNSSSNNILRQIFFTGNR